MKKNSTLSQIYRVGEPELAGLLLAIPVTNANDANFNTAINNYLTTPNRLDPLLKADEPAHDAEIIYNRAHPDATKTFKLAVYFNASNARFGIMHPVTYNAANGEITTVADAFALGANLPLGPPTNGAVNPMHGLTVEEYQILEFTNAEIALLKGINKGGDVENLATKIQLVTQSFRQLYDKIPDKTIAKAKITAIINTAVANAGGASFKAYCGVLVNIGKAYDKGSEKFDGVSVELDINYPVALNATPVIIDQRPITDQNDVTHLLNFAITCLGAKVTGLGGLAGGKRKRNRKSSKRRSQKKSRKSKKRSNKRKSRKSRKSRRIRRKSYKK